MGQLVCTSIIWEGRRHTRGPKGFPDLSYLPPEVAILVLSHLNATDLCLAACVNEHWQRLADIELLWKNLCFSQWGNVKAFYPGGKHPPSYKKLYLVLDDGSSLFNGDPHSGIAYLLEHNVLDASSAAIARFLHMSQNLHADKVLMFLEARPDVLDALVWLQDFQRMSLPDALRHFFTDVPAPKERARFLELVLGKFSERFHVRNPQMHLSSETVYVLCYSLILLSVDLGSPHVKNKMSKREFIRNLRGAVHGVTTDYLGDLYDNIYLYGHVASKTHYKVLS